MSQRIPSAISDRRPDRAPTSRFVLVTTRETRSAPRAKAAAFAANGRAMPAANRNAPIGGATSWLVSRNPPWSRALAIPRSSRVTRPGSSVLEAESAKVSAVPRMKSAASTTPMFTVPLTIVATSAIRTTDRPRFAMTTSLRRSTRSAMTPPSTPNRKTGRRSLSRAIETRSGSRVMDATSNGPADRTMPSPMLLMTVADRRNRKLRPRRAGAMISRRDLVNRHTSSRIPAALHGSCGRGRARSEPHAV